MTERLAVAGAGATTVERQRAGRGRGRPSRRGMWRLDLLLLRVAAVCRV